MGEKWKILAQETAFAASPYLEVVRQRIETGAGRIVDDFWQVKLRPFTMCVPLLGNGKVLAIRQYKHGPGRVSLAFPAGFADPLETPELTGRRELLEETGLAAGTMLHLGEFVDNGNQRGCVGNYYLAGNCTKIREPDSGDLEAMELVELTFAELDAAMFDGSIAIAHAALAWGLARLKLP